MMGGEPRTPKAVLSSLSLLLSVSLSLSQPPSSPAGRGFSRDGINEWYPKEQLETGTAVKELVIRCEYSKEGSRRTGHDHQPPSL